MANGTAIPTISDAEVYSKSLSELLALRNDFALFKWRPRLATATEAQKLEFSRLRALINKQIRILTNARLSDILKELRKNEAGLIAGIQKSQEARQHFENVEKAFKAFGAFVSIVGRLAAVAAKALI
jgi:hypothetical protein